MTERLPDGHVFAGLLRNGYKAIMCDPATDFRAGKKGRPQHYDRQTDREIAAMPVADLVHPDGCFLMLWATTPKTFRPARSRMLLRPDEIASAWGFRFSSNMFTWVKTSRRSANLSKAPLFIHPSHGMHMGMGYSTRKNVELCWLFRAGRPVRIAKNISELIFAPVREHSRKPDEAFEGIERFCAGPYLELYSRQPRLNWDTWGREREKFADAA
jgi:N6-adenosine-specific RNA methylase IME4